MAINPQFRNVSAPSAINVGNTSLKLGEIVDKAFSGLGDNLDIVNNKKIDASTNALLGRIQGLSNLDTFGGDRDNILAGASGYDQARVNEGILAQQALLRDNRVQDQQYKAGEQAFITGGLRQDQLNKNIGFMDTRESRAIAQHENQLRTANLNQQATQQGIDQTNRNLGGGDVFKSIIGEQDFAFNKQKGIRNFNDPNGDLVYDPKNDVITLSEKGIAMSQVSEGLAQQLTEQLGKVNLSPSERQALDITHMRNKLTNTLRSQNIEGVSDYASQFDSRYDRANLTAQQKAEAEKKAGILKHERALALKKAGNKGGKGGSYGYGTKGYNAVEKDLVTRFKNPTSYDAANFRKASNTLRSKFLFNGVPYQLSPDQLYNELDSHMSIDPEGNDLFWDDQGFDKTYGQNDMSSLVSKYGLKPITTAKDLKK